MYELRSEVGPVCCCCFWGMGFGRVSVIASVFVGNGPCCFAGRVGWVNVFAFACVVGCDDAGSSVLMFDCGREVRLHLALPLLVVVGFEVRVFVGFGSGAGG